MRTCTQRVGCGKSVDWHTRLKADQTAKLQPPPDFESTTIGDFGAQVLRKKDHLDALNLDAENLTALHVSGADVQNLIRQSADGEDHISQPIFAYELKVLMHQYAEKVGSSTRTRPKGA